MDKIGAFLSFCHSIMKQFSKHHHIFRNTGDVYLSKTDAEGRSVIQLIHFQQVHSAFGFRHHKSAKKNGRKTPKIYFSKESYLQKNSLIGRRS